MSKDPRKLEERPCWYCGSDSMAHQGDGQQEWWRCSNCGATRCPGE